MITVVGRGRPDAYISDATKGKVPHMRKVLAAALLIGAAVPSVALANARSSARARVYRAEAGSRLSLPSRDGAAKVAVEFMRARGQSGRTTDSVREVGAERRANGLTHVRFAQEVDGLRVHGAYAKAVVSDAGELVHLVDFITTVPKSGWRSATATERQALRAVLRQIHPGLRGEPGEIARSGNTIVYSKGGYFHSDPTVERVLIPMAGGTLEEGFVVETWTTRGNLLHETLVGRDGKVIETELRTNTDSYRVFPEDPSKGGQVIVNGPAPGGVASPNGWLGGGSQLDTFITGNNVRSYLDAVADNAPDSGGTAVSGGDFLATFDATVEPSTPGNRAVAVQNLFYLNNVIHDALYAAGFDEVAGNFQADNFGRGGSRGADAVEAQAQDGGGTDNANFATPRDGKAPRMQMYLWHGSPTHLLTTSIGEFPAGGASWGAQLTATGVSGAIVAATDAGGVSANDGCEAFTANSPGGQLALVDRGNCNFTVKAKNAQLAGYLGVVIANNQGGDTIQSMGGEDTTVTIPGVLISQNNGAALRAASSPTGTMHLKDPPPLFVDGDLDSDIVFHEYGHGLTWRMIGRMSGPMSGAIGEGMSDVLAIVMNGDDRVGEYSFSDARGIRSVPYASYTRTYAQLYPLTEVHLDGELYAAIGWRMLQAFGPGRASELLGYLVDGMNYTPAGPMYEDMRDGILAGMAASGASQADQCIVWDAFASGGVGVGAKGSERRAIVESFVVPAACQ
jgi:extracellular elastinolytic metalloproteinase